MKCLFLVSLICSMIPACLGVWECTYIDGLGLQTTKTCSSGCCEHDCCPFDGALFGGIFGGLFVFCLIVACCIVCIRRRRRQATPGIIVMGAQTTVTTSTTVGAPVPEHQGYDQPNYQPSSFARPPPYTQVQA